MWLVAAASAVFVPVAGRVVPIAFDLPDIDGRRMGEVASGLLALLLVGAVWHHLWGIVLPSKDQLWAPAVPDHPEGAPDGATVLSPRWVEARVRDLGSIDAPWLSHLSDDAVARRLATSALLTEARAIRDTAEARNQRIVLSGRLVRAAYFLGGVAWVLGNLAERPI